MSIETAAKIPKSKNRDKNEIEKKEEVMKKFSRVLGVGLQLDWSNTSHSNRGKWARVEPGTA